MPAPHNGTACPVCSVGKTPQMHDFRCASCGVLQHAECQQWAKGAIVALSFVTSDLPAVYFCKDCIINFTRKPVYSQDTIKSHVLKINDLTAELNLLKSTSPSSEPDELAALKNKYETEVTRAVGLTNQLIVMEQENQQLNAHIAELDKVSPKLMYAASGNKDPPTETEARFAKIEAQIGSIAASMASFANAVNIQTSTLSKPPVNKQQPINKQLTKQQVIPPTKPLARQKNRARSTSQPPPLTGAIPKKKQGSTSGKPQPPKHQIKQFKADVSNRTFASIVANTASALQPKRIVQRNADTAAADFNAIKLDRSFNVTGIREATADKFTVTFDSNAQAIAFDECFLEKHGEKATSIAPRIISPQFKLTGPFGTLLIEDIVSALVNQNNHITADSIHFVRRYASGLLETVIFKCDQLILNAIVSKGSVLFGLQSIRCHEVIEILQCSKCCEYGHTMAKCKAPQQICKICSKNHKHTGCPTPNAPCCINCVNTPATTDIPIATAHRATHDRCPIRMARLSVVKSKLAKQ